MWHLFVRLFQVKMEREQYQTEIRDLQDQLSEMHDELDSAKKTAADGEKDMLIAVMHGVHCLFDDKMTLMSSCRQSLIIGKQVLNCISHTIMLH